MIGLPAGFTLRHTAPADVAAAQAMLDAVESAEVGEPRHSPLDIAADCQSPRLELERDTWLVLAPEGDLAAFGFVFWGESAQGEAEPFVLPRYRGLGLGDALLETIEARASNARRSRRSTSIRDCTSSAARTRCVVAGGFWTTGIAPSGRGASCASISRTTRRLRPLCPSGSSFASSPRGATTKRSTPRPTRRSPSTSSTCRRRWRSGARGSSVVRDSTRRFGSSPGTATRSPGSRWRTRTATKATWIRCPCGRRGAAAGLGLALLTRVVGRAHDRGMRKIRLGVDAQNPTGALALYFRAGMYVERRRETYAKDLR